MSWVSVPHAPRNTPNIVRSSSTNQATGRPCYEHSNSFIPWSHFDWNVRWQMYYTELGMLTNDNVGALRTCLRVVLVDQQHLVGRNKAVPWLTVTWISSLMLRPHCRLTSRPSTCSILRIDCHFLHVERSWRCSTSVTSWPSTLSIHVAVLYTVCIYEFRLQVDRWDRSHYETFFVATVIVTFRSRHCTQCDRGLTAGPRNIYELGSAFSEQCEQPLSLTTDESNLLIYSRFSHKDSWLHEHALTRNKWKCAKFSITQYHMRTANVNVAWNSPLLV
jgi:hypothetical protein